MIRDLETGNAAEKIDLSALSDGVAPRDWQAAMMQDGNDVIIATGADSSIRVLNSDLASLFEYHLIA